MNVARFTVLIGFSPQIAPPPITAAVSHMRQATGRAGRAEEGRSHRGAKRLAEWLRPRTLVSRQRGMAN